jgi:hypothetical protein
MSVKATGGAGQAVPCSVAKTLDVRYLYASQHGNSGSLNQRPSVTLDVSPSYREGEQCIASILLLTLVDV